MKILIVSYRFSPDVNIAALRPTKVAKYLARAGHEVSVLTASGTAASRRGPETVDSGLLRDVWRVGHSRLFLEFAARKERFFTARKRSPAGESARPPARRSAFRELLGFAFRQFVDIFRSLDFYLAFRRAIKTDPSFVTDCDCMLSSYGPLSSLLCGLYLRKKFRVRWVCDFQDPMQHAIKYRHYRLLRSIFQARACALADRVTTVSEGFRKDICGSRFGSRSVSIPNGYDPEDTLAAVPGGHPKRFLVYAGTVYPGWQDFSPLVSALGQLVAEGTIPRDRPALHYAGKYYCHVRPAFLARGLDALVRDHGWLERENCLDLQRSAFCLLLLTWNSPGEEGILPAKGFEYMLLGRPIISLSAGALPGAEMTGVVRQANLGVAYEAAGHDRDFPALLDFLRRQYRRFAAGREPEYDPDREYVARFDYRNIARSFEKVLAAAAFPGRGGDAP